MREEGLEPSRLLRHRNLNPARLPIPPLALSGTQDGSGSRSRARCVSGRAVFLATSFLPTSDPDGEVVCEVMALRGFEDRLERMVEGIFSRAFKSGLQPVEVGRKLIREVDANRSIDVRGRRTAPNKFLIRLALEDHERFYSIQESLIRELAGSLREHAQEQDLFFLGHVSIIFQADPELREGTFRVMPSFDESTESSSPVFLELPDGSELVLGREAATIGRLTESTIVLHDPNASRRHAELQPDGDSYALVDLGSTNGSRVNGIKIERQVLRDGDELTFGTVNLTFRLL